MALPDSMRAVRLHQPRTSRTEQELRVDEVARPSPAAGQVLVEVRACGIGGTDAQLVAGDLPTGTPLPRILGHEAAGVVADVGEAVADWQPGDRVALLPTRSCGTCPYCTIGRDNLCARRNTPGLDDDGSLAGYTLASPWALVPVPPDLPFAQAAITTDAVASPYHALKRAGVSEGSTVAILGLGGLGMHAVLLCKLAGATVIGVDRDVVNLDRALAWGADEVVDATRDAPEVAVRTLSDGGTDRTLEFVGDPATTRQAVACLAPGGRAVLVGLTGAQLTGIRQDTFVTTETELVGSFGATTQDLGEVFDLLDAGRLDLSRSVTAEIGLDEVADALHGLETRQTHPVRTVVTDLA